MGFKKKYMGCNDEQHKSKKRKGKRCRKLIEETESSICPLNGHRSFCSFLSLKKKKKSIFLLLEFQERGERERERKRQSGRLP